MICDFFWLTEDQFARLQPLLPTDTRGKPRVDDRRVISGIIHVLKSGGRWIDAPAAYGPRKTLYNRFVRRAAPHLHGSLDRQRCGQGAPLRLRRQRGERAQAIGRSRGGRTTKIHALTDGDCRPIAFVLTGGQIADCTAAAQLLEKMPQASILHGDKGYDSNAVRRQVEDKGALPKSRPRPTGAGKTASRHSFTATATPSSACFAG